MKQSNRIMLALVTVLLLLATAGNIFAAGAKESSGQAATSGSNTIVFIPKSTDVTYWLFLRKGAADKAKELGYKLDYQGVARESDVAGQVNLVRNVAATKPAGILLAATDATALVDPVKEAMASGVPVVMVDSGVNQDVAVASITTDNYGGAKASGDLLAKLIGGMGKVINLGITAGSETGNQRDKGFTDAMKAFPSIKVLPTQWTGAEAAVALNDTNDLLTANPDVNGIYSAAAPMGVGAAQALKARNLQGKVKLITFDPSPEVIPLFKDGTIQAIIAQDPYQMGYRGVDTIDRYRKGESIANKSIQIPVQVITPDNFNTPEMQKLIQTPGTF